MLLIPEKQCTYSVILLPQLNIANNTCQIENFSASESLTICQHFTKFLIWIEMQMPLGYVISPGGGGVSVS